MRHICVVIAMAGLLAGCDAAKESGDKTARELTLCVLTPCVHRRK